MKLRELGELGVRYMRRFCNYLTKLPTGVQLVFASPLGTDLFTVTLPLIFAYNHFAACMPQGNVVNHRCFLSEDW